MLRRFMVDVVLFFLKKKIPVPGGVYRVQVVLERLVIAFCTACHHQYATMELNIIKFTPGVEVWFFGNKGSFAFFFFTLNVWNIVALHEKYVFRN